jgi:multimeric flavodoxin WrbA
MISNLDQKSRFSVKYIGVIKNMLDINFSGLQSFASNKESLEQTIKYLLNKNKVLLLATSNRWEGHEDDTPKSTLLAKIVKAHLGEKAELIDVSKLHIYICEGNVSSKEGNHCGTKDSVLKDKSKNPSGHHRCWASINNKDDELWKISKPLFESDAIVFFTSIRWGQTNSIYQKLIERLCWIENRHSTLKEDNIIKNIDAGVIAIGQNWNGANVIETQKKVLSFYGFNTPNQLSWNWQYTQNPLDETKESYNNAIIKFKNTFL